MPYERYEHTLEKQDYEAIRHWCLKCNVKKLQVDAYTVTCNKISGELDVMITDVQFPQI